MADDASARPILVGVDGSPSSLDALRKAAEFAKLLKTPLGVVTAWQYPVGFAGAIPPPSWSPEADAEAIQKEALQAVFPDGPPEGTTTTIAAGPAAGVLIDRSKDASMLVLGSRGRGGFVGMLLGSVSAACAEHAHCPVLILH